MKFIFAFLVVILSVLATATNAQTDGDKVPDTPIPVVVVGVDKVDM